MDSAKGTAKQLRDLSKIYMEAIYGGGKKEEKKDTRLVVTAADKKANTKAYQNYKAGNKAYKAADHLGEEHGEDTQGKKNCGCGQDPCVTYGKQDKKSMKEEKKAAKDYDGDGKIESGTDEYMGSRDKAIKKAMGKKIKEARWWDVDVIEEQKAESPEEEEEKDKEDDELEGSPNQKKKKVKHNCASKVKHEEYGLGTCVKGMHTLDEEGNVSHYDVLFEHGVEKNLETSTLNILEYSMHEHVINYEKNRQIQEQKDTPDQVAAVIDMYRSKKGTGEAVKDTEEGKKKAAKKERDYAAFEREKMRRDDPNWKHKKGSTTESVEADKYIETVKKVKEEELEADIKRWSALEESGKFTKEEIESLKEAERDLGDRLHRKRKLYDRTVTKAMDFARREGEAAGHARYRMGQLDREMDKVKDKMKEKEKK